MSKYAEGSAEAISNESYEGNQNHKACPAFWGVRWIFQGEAKTAARKESHQLIWFLALSEDGSMPKLECDAGVMPCAGLKDSHRLARCPTGNLGCLFPRVPKAPRMARTQFG